MVVDKKDENFTTVMEKMSTKMGENNVRRTTNNQKVLHIRDIDAVTTDGEIKEAIEKAVGAKTATLNSIEISNIRPMQGSCQIATVKTTEEVAKVLLKEGRVLVGFTRCRVKLRQEVIKCFKCWGYNHTAANCNGPDRTKDCLKCAEKGHQVKDCQNESFCPLCMKKGHRVRSGEGPKHREAFTNTK